MDGYCSGHKTAGNEIFNMNSDVILAIDIKGVLVCVNAAAERIFRQLRADLVGRDILSLVRPDFHKEISTYISKQICEKLPNCYYEYPVVDSGGGTLWLGQNTRLLVHNGRVEGLAATARDITYRRADHKEQLDGAAAASINELHCTAPRLNSFRPETPDGN